MLIRKLACTVVIIFLLLSNTGCFENTPQNQGSNPGNNPDNETVNTPKDTYFSIAVSDGSNNHVGNTLVFLKFQDAEPDPTVIRNDTVISPHVENGSITIDGSASEWNDINLTSFTGLVLNNYPLSHSIDATPTTIKIGSSWDSEYIYFIVQWEDSNHIQNSEYKKWVYSDDPINGIHWAQKASQGVIELTPPAPSQIAINKLHRLAGMQLDDQLVLAFPIIDSSNNFQANGFGCGAYCHIDWDQEDPNSNYTGDTSATMYTLHADDKLDIWHWSAGRSHHAGYADDLYLHNRFEQDSGIRNDAGQAPYNINELANEQPQFIPLGGINNDHVLLADNIALNNVTPTLKNEIPSIITAIPSLSRADITASASFDVNTYRWTVELKRRLITETPDDYQFTKGTDTGKPTNTLVVKGNSTNGETLYNTHCLACHLNEGLGSAADDVWIYPRIQRTSGTFIANALEEVLAMDLAAKALGSNRSQRAQASEDIASYLQTMQFFEIPKHSIAIQSDAFLGFDGLFTSVPAGINCPPTCTFNFDELSEITISFDTSQQLDLTGWGLNNKCENQTVACTFIAVADESITPSVELKPVLFQVNIGNNGNGRVESTPLGIDCGLQCGFQFEEGTEIILHQTPANANFEFNGWVGDICQQEAGDCTFIISKDTTLSAKFDAVSSTP